MIRKTLALVTLSLTVAGTATAQTSSRPVVLEGHAGYAEFIDSPPTAYAVFGASGRVFISQRVAIGPELTWMRGPDIDRYWFLTGNATIDLRRGGASTRVMPYVIGGLGLLTHESRVGTGPYTNQELTFTTGIGVRAPIVTGWYIAPEFRIGGDGHWRTGASLGKTWD